jgi:hypothetical protein
MLRATFVLDHFSRNRRIPARPSTYFSFQKYLSGVRVTHENIAEAQEVYKKHFGAELLHVDGLLSPSSMLLALKTVAAAAAAAAAHIFSQ